MKQLKAPPNAHAHGSSWVCNKGYKRVANHCNPLVRVTLHAPVVRRHCHKYPAAKHMAKLYLNAYQKH